MTTLSVFLFYFILFFLTAVTAIITARPFMVRWRGHRKRVSCPGRLSSKVMRSRYHGSRSFCCKQRSIEKIYTSFFSGEKKWIQSGENHYKSDEIWSFSYMQANHTLPSYVTIQCLLFVLLNFAKEFCSRGKPPMKRANLIGSGNTERKTF